VTAIRPAKWYLSPGTPVTRKTAAGLFKSIFTRKSHCPLWTFPAGRWIPGKTLPDAVLREAAENTGLRAGATG